MKRLPVKLHRRVCLVVTEDAVLAEELLARKKLAQDVAGRLSDRALLIRSGKVEAVLEELRRMGHTPQVVGRLPDSKSSSLSNGETAAGGPMRRGEPSPSAST